jgi:hypothetical protein
MARASLTPKFVLEYPFANIEASTRAPAKVVSGRAAPLNT